MTIKLDDYIGCMNPPPPEAREILEASYLEASWVMSPAGLHTYLEGAKALCALGRGSDPVISYLQEMPAVAKELGEDAIGGCSNAALRLASLVSGAVISELLASLPTAARRLGDPELLQGYLNLVHQLASKAPRGLRPMLTHIDALLGKLTLGGLRRWALWGAQAHARDFEAQTRYFNLASADSHAVFQRERRGTLFIDSQRKLNCLSGMRGGLSTRIGAALRHAASHLMRQPQQKKLLLLVTDGEPADIDERDPQYLRHDTKKAVDELATQGISTFCLTLDPEADAYVSRIFGPNNYSILDNVRRLPERLPSLFAGLTR